MRPGAVHQQPDEEEDGEEEEEDGEEGEEREEGEGNSEQYSRTRSKGPEGEEICRVLGGGVVLGSLVLVSGSPGAGKSTLLLQLAGLLAEEARGSLTGGSPLAVLYVSGEEVGRWGEVDLGRGLANLHAAADRKLPAGCALCVRGGGALGEVGLERWVGRGGWPFCLLLQTGGSPPAVLYVSGEEVGWGEEPPSLPPLQLPFPLSPSSPPSLQREEQLATRAKRLGITADNLFLLSENNLEWTTPLAAYHCCQPPPALPEQPRGTSDNQPT
ncbi:unnamed protein product [Closterium sp. NIES-65]|nr:unnamed protein product [Closterium sp. NIES-65]